MMIPAFLSEFIRTIIIMSLSGGLLALLLLAVKPFVRHLLPKLAQYCFWLVALAAFLIPVSRIVTLPDTIADITPIHSAVERNIISTTEARDRLLDMAMPDLLTAPNFNFAPATTFANTPPTEEPGLISRAVTIFMVIYPFIFVLVLLYSLIGYSRFTKKLRRGYIIPHSFELDMLGELTNGKRTPRLIVSDYATTPMLIGVFGPIIVLPNREYTTEQLQSILLHELTHMRRFDVAVKWFSLLACAVHWFNPLVWIARREIDRACELSCDEAVIHNMDKYGKQHYGETLITMASTKKIPLLVVSTTMCEEKRALKERLTAIMKSKRYTKLTVLISTFILLAAVLTACAVGVRGGNSDYNTDVTTNYNSPIVNNSPLTVHDFTMLYIEELSAGLNVGVFPYGVDEDYFYIRPANIIDTQINVLSEEAIPGDSLPYEIELWRLDFMLLTNDLEDGYLRWGTFSPDAEGWVGQHTGWNDARTLLVFSRENDNLSLLGSIPWYMEENSVGLVAAVREFFRQNHTTDTLSPISHVGAAHETHRIVNAMPLPRNDMALRTIQIGADHGGFGYGAYTLTIHYDLHGNDLTEAPGADFERIAIRLFSLIENLQAVTFSIVGNETADTDDYIYRWSISRLSHEIGGGAVTATEFIPPEVTTLLSTIAIGMARDAVENLFPSTAIPQIAYSAYTGERLYRYDLIKDNDYVFICPHGLDTLDIDGLQEGRVRLVIFIDYAHDNTVERYTAYYTISDGSIYEIRVRADGTRLISRILDGGE